MTTITYSSYYGSEYVQCTLVSDSITLVSYIPKDLAIVGNKVRIEYENDVVIYEVMAVWQREPAIDGGTEECER